MQVEDFKQEGEGLSLEEFEGQASPGARLNNKSASQLAATSSLLTEPTVDGFRAIKEELLDPDKRERFLLRQEEMRKKIFEDSRGSVLNTVSDPTASDQDKFLSSVGASLTPEEVLSSPESTLKTLAEESVASDSGTNESEQSARSRNSLIGSISDVVQSKREAAAAIASLKLGQDQGFLGDAVDVAELFAPFAEWIHIDRLQKDVTGQAEFKLMGQQKQILFDQIKSLPVSERGRFIENIIRLMENHEAVVLRDGNDLVNLDILENMLLDDDYSNFERFFDNATSLLEVTGVASLLRGATRTSKAAGRAAKGLDGEILDSASDVSLRESRAQLESPFIEGEFEDVTERLSRARLEATHTDVDPASPSQVIKATNPEQARNTHAVMRDDSSGEAAESLYGTTREEAMAKDLLPEPELAPKEMPNKVEMRRPVHEEPEKIKKLRLANGNTAVSEAELGKVVQSVVDGTEVSVGKIHKGSQTIRANDDGTFGVSMMFRPFDSGYGSPQEAFSNAEFAFRNYGLSEDNLTLLKRSNDKWVETSVADEEAASVLRAAGADSSALAETDYAVGIDFNYRFRPEDLTEVDLLQTGNMITRTLDGIGGGGFAGIGQGSVSQNLFDASSIIHPQIVNAASVAVDRAVGLKSLYVEEFQEFTDFWSKAPSDRRVLMTDYINKANFDGIPFNTTDLYARGFSEKEVEALRAWRRSNDAMWHATNDDMAKTLRASGVQVLQHKDSGTTLFGRPVSKTSAMNSNTRSVYDPVEGVSRSIDNEELSELYDLGAELIKLSSPVQVDGAWVDTALSRNTSQGGFTRAIADGEVVLPYRDGYYPVMYDANYFVEMKVRLADGTTSTKVVASAKNTEDAKRAVESLSKSHPDATISFRQDRRAKQDRGDTFDSGSWSLAQSSGLTAQRLRGERVMDAGVDLHRAGNTNLVDPLEAIGNQIHQLSQRVSMRTYLETVKKRWMLNYGDKLDLPVDPVTGEKSFPRSVKDIKNSTSIPNGEIANARTNFNYIYSLENGYINGIDEAYKAVANYAASKLGELGFSKFEEVAFDTSKMNPTQRAKTLAFRLFISGNPARQALIQRGQMLMLGAINPKAVPQIMSDLVALDSARLGALKGNKRIQDLLKEIEDVGLLQSVDAHNLIREDTLRLADMTFAQKVAGKAEAPLKFLQKAGFDLAEQDVLVSSYLAHRDLAVKAGKNMKSQRVKDEVLGQARAFTLTMNRAGEMPYSQNTLGFIAQFFSFRHKALLQGLTNKSLTPLERAQVLGYTTAMFGIDASILAAAYHSLWGDTAPNELKDKVEQGLLDYTLNTALTLATGQDQAIDFGDFAPTEAYGIGNVFIGMMTTDLGEMIANAPAGSLLFGANPRVTQAFKTGARYFNVIDDYDDPQLDTRLSDVVRASANLFSGYSNSFKGNYAYHTRQKMSSTGRITDEDVTTAEAVATAFGFRTKDEVGRTDVYNEMYGDSAAFSDDVKSWYKDLKIHLARRGQSVAEVDMSRRVLSEAWRVFGEDKPRAWEIISKELKKDAQNGDYQLITNIISGMGFRTEEENWKIINSLPEGDLRRRLTETMQFGKDVESGN